MSYYFDGKRLHDEIARRQQTVPEFAQEAKVSRFSVYRALAGSRAGTKTLGKIAAALGVKKPSELLQCETPEVDELSAMEIRGGEVAV